MNRFPSDQQPLSQEYWAREAVAEADSGASGWFWPLVGCLAIGLAAGALYGLYF